MGEREVDVNMCLESLSGCWDWRDWSVVVTGLWVDVEKKRDDWISVTFPRRLGLLSKIHQRIGKNSPVHSPYDDSK